VAQSEGLCSRGDSARSISSARQSMPSRPRAVSLVLVATISKALDPSGRGISTSGLSASVTAAYLYRWLRVKDELLTWQGSFGPPQPRGNVLSSRRRDRAPELWRKLRATPREARAVPLRLRRRAVLVRPDVTIQMRRHPMDDKFLECAVSGAADYVVSADANLLSLREVRGIPILDDAPRFWRRLTEHGDQR
jgi:hypothetical protein